jgi:gamma-tubulin complex component 3
MMLTLIAVEALFMADREGDLQMMMDTAYLETSRRVLDVLIGQYKFLEHLQALRRYLLLGQGDFIRHLMELLELVWLFTASTVLFVVSSQIQNF